MLVLLPVLGQAHHFIPPVCGFRDGVAACWVSDAEAAVGAMWQSKRRVRLGATVDDQLLR